MIITHETTPLQSEAANQLDTCPIVVVIINGILYILWVVGRYCKIATSGSDDPALTSQGR